MPRKPRENPINNISNLAKMMENKIKRNSYIFTYNCDGTNYYKVDGEEVSVKDFEERFPINLVFRADKGENSDKTKNWMQDKKSY